MIDPDESAPSPVIWVEDDGVPALPGLLVAEIESAAVYAKASRASSTQRVYASDWRIFTAWCSDRAIEPLPADPRAVATFLAAEADKGAKPATIGRRLAAIGYHHKQAGLQPPQAREGAAVISQVLGGIRRSKGVRPVRKRAADGDALRDMLRAIDGDGLRSARDRAVLALGMAAALRRSEIVALTLDDVELVPEGLKVIIRGSKTDQERAGVVIAVPEGRRIRPKALLLAWMKEAAHEDGPLFRKLTPGDRLTDRGMSDRAVARLVQKHAAAAGYDPSEFAGHSLRAGFLTEAEASGASIFKMQEVSRHKSVQVLAAYVRSRELFREHAGEKFL
ncbi:site-specific integrase [Sphingomonas sp. Leaf67]|uniref:site-specific integrase n=1 Tax=Sphingomonas sp. Leaf67 TaxID=1736230 RepID=UPI0009E854CD|nr:site-specific integrase [Sphingomonas sp. Leaf67]